MHHGLYYYLFILLVCIVYLTELHIIISLYYLYNIIQSHGGTNIVAVLVPGGGLFFLGGAIFFGGGRQFGMTYITNSRGVLTSACTCIYVYVKLICTYMCTRIHTKSLKSVFIQI